MERKMKKGLLIFACMMASTVASASTWKCGNQLNLDFGRKMVSVWGQEHLPAIANLVVSNEGVYAVSQAALRVRNVDFSAFYNMNVNNSRVKVWSFIGRELSGDRVYFQQKLGKSELIYISKEKNVKRLDCQRN